MSVRVNKSAFNIREKLSELERPIGVKGNELMRAETTQDARDLVSAGRKNMVINGDMRIWQRGNAGSVNATDGLYIDRFKCRNSTDGTLTISSQASSTAGPSGESFRYVMKLDCDGADTSLSGLQYARIQQFIEGQNLNMDWGISNTDFITLSFWVKSNKPGIYCCNIEDGDVGRIYVKEYTINTSDVWQKIEITYPPPPAGTWKNFDNSTGLRITWSLGTGSTYQGSADSWGTTYIMGTSRQTNFMDNANNTFYLTGVQLEVGKNATEFEHRSYGEELVLCQRYYYKTRVYLQSYQLSNQDYSILLHHPVELRSGTSWTANSLGDSYTVNVSNTVISGVPSTVSSPSTDGSKAFRIYIRATNSSYVEKGFDMEVSSEL